MARYGFGEFLTSIIARWRAQSKQVEVATPEPAPVEAPEPTITWVDMRAEKRTKSRGKHKGIRKWDTITGVTLHQTAVVVSRPERCLNMPVHAVVLADGLDAATIVLLHDPTHKMWHGNGFNTRDIGIEVACRACGIEGDPRTLWLPKKLDHLEGDERLVQATEATDAQLEGARQLLKYYDDLVKENGGGLLFVHAHRQATKNRVSDPGSRIWGAVGQWANAELGLAVGDADFHISDGKPLPDAWTGQPNGVKYNWRVDGRISAE